MPDYLERYREKIRHVKNVSRTIIVSYLICTSIMFIQHILFNHFWRHLHSCTKGFITPPLCMIISRHYNDVIMSAMASQITGVSVVCPTVGSVADHRKHQSSASLAFVQGIHRWPVNSPHKRPVTRKMFPFDDVIMNCHIYPIWAGTSNYTPQYLRNIITCSYPWYLLLAQKSSYVCIWKETASSVKICID